MSRIIAWLQNIQIILPSLEVYLEPRRDQTKELICQWLKDEWYRW
jgi:hypothetical protein